MIIPVYNVEAYLAACLNSVLSQSLKNLEILIVDDGSTDRCPEIIAEFAHADSRIRAFRQDNAGQGPARNFAVGRARGRFLTFLDADDIIPPGTYQYMVNSLKKSGSDFSIGSVRRVRHGQTSQPAWNIPVHAQDRIGIRIDDFPTALQDVIACNRMFQRSFWIANVGGFRGGMVYEDHVPMVAAYLRASSFDILSRVTYHWRIREDMTSTGQQKHALVNLRDRVAVKAEAYEIVQQEASPTVQAAWTGRVLDTDFPPYIEHALVADSEYQTMLAEAFAYYRSIADPEALSHVRLQQKIRGYLAAEGRWDQMEPVQKFFREGGALPRTVVRNGRIYAADALRDTLGLDLPDDVLELSAQETALRACLRQAEWVGPGLLRLTGWSFIRGLDFDGETPQLAARLVDPTGDEEVELTVTSLSLPEATRWSGQWYASCDPTGFQLTIDTAGLPPADRTERTWQLRMAVTAKGISREGSVPASVTGSSAAAAALTAAPAGDRTAVPRLDPALGFVVTLRPSPFVAIELDSTATARTLTGRFVAPAGGNRSADDPSQPLVPVTLRATEKAVKQVVETAVQRQPDGSYTFALSLPAIAAADGPTRASGWDLRVVGDDNTSAQLEWPADLPGNRVPFGPATAGATCGDYSGAGYWERLPRGGVRVSIDQPSAQVSRIEVSADEFVVTLTADAVTNDQLATAELANTLVTVAVTMSERLPDGSARLRFPNTVTQFGWPARPLARGAYWLAVADVNGTIFQLGAAADLHQQLPVDFSTPTHQVRFTVTGANQLRLNLEPPLPASDRGNLNQMRLRTYYQRLDATPEPSVLFQCYRGETATDSQLALHSRLRARDADLSLYWGVADYATPVPEGGIALLIGSRAWFDQLASSTYLCNNIDFDGFFRKRSHQRYLQTFHGYPFKSMGRTFWAGKGLSAARIAAECARRNAEYDAIVVPSEICADFYRQEYDYSGEILVTGYPRSDVLLSPAAGGIRDRVRTGLGLDPDHQVVLYAPTYRDALTTRTYAAKRFDELDLDLLTEQLDDAHVILIRGHNNNQREPDRVRGRARILDVTDYPEINDLTLAADVAVLDYSSLRFDWAVTGKPMLFFVPDLQGYFAARPPLFEFRSSAPGPLLNTTEEVVEALKNLPDVSARYRGEIAAFNQTYNELQDGQATERVLDAFFDR